MRHARWGLDGVVLRACTVALTGCQAEGVAPHSASLTREQTPTDTPPNRLSDEFEPGTIRRVGAVPGVDVWVGRNHEGDIWYREQP